jgi:CheY-like chemotaxis protein
MLADRAYRANVSVPRKRILIADDDPAIAKMLSRLLGRDHDVVVAEDGATAVALATKEPTPDLALLDIMMPVMDGLTVAQQIKNHPNLKKIPIIFITARSTPMDVIKGIQVGARSYITKPFTLDDVRDKVAKALKV